MSNQLKRVLIVDDNPINRMLLRHIVERDYQVDEAENGQEAFSLVYDRRRLYSAVLLDILMPVMDGFTFLRRLRRDPLMQSLPVVVISEAGDSDTELRALTLGANDFMKKPYEPMIIRQRLSNIIRLKDLTDRETRTEQEQQLIDRLPCCIAICTVSDRLRVRYVSEGIQSVTGYEPSEYRELFADDALMAIAPDYRAQILQTMQQCAAQKAPIDLEYQAYYKDGAERWTAMRGQYAGTDQDTAVYYCLMTDATDAKQAADRLLTSESQLRLAFEQSSLDLLSYSYADNVLKYTEKPGGLNREIQYDLDSSVLRARIHQKSLADYDRAREQVRAGQSPITAELRVRRGARYRWYRFSMSIIGEGSERRLVGVCRDINDEVESRSAYELEAGFRRALTEGAIACSEFDLDADRLLTKDDPLPAMLGLTADCTMREYADTAIAQFVHPDDRHLFEQVVAIIHAPGALHEQRARERVIECRICGASFGGYRWVTVSFSFILNPSTGRRHMFVCVRDIDERKTAQLAMMEKAQRDPLTGLYNRSAFVELLNVAIDQRADAADLAAFLIIDVDNFKQVNDTRGHAYGDEVLVSLGEQLRALFRKSDILGRLGGDEFVIFMPHVPDEQLVLSKGVAVCRALGGLNDGALTLSVGASILPKHGTAFEELYANADAALYRAKQAGKNTCCIFDGQSATPTLCTPQEPALLSDEFDDLVLVVDAETFELLYCNRAARLSFGLSEDYVGRPCFQALYNRSDPCARCNNGELGFEQFTVHRVHNRFFNTEFIIKNRLIHWHGRTARLEIAIDVNRSKTVDALLAAAEARLNPEDESLRFLLSHISAATLQYYPADDELVYSVLGDDGSGAERRTPDFSTVLLQSSVLHPDDRDKFAACFAEKPGLAREQELVFRARWRSSEDMRWYRLSLRRVYEGAALTRVFGIIQPLIPDTTLRTGSGEDAQLAQAQTVDIFLQEMPVGTAVLLLSDEIRPVFLSDGLCRLLGRDRAALSALFNEGRIAAAAPDDSQSLRAALLEKAEAQQPIDRIFRAERADGQTIWLRVLAVPTFIPSVYNALFVEVSAEYNELLRLQQLCEEAQLEALIDPLTGLFTRETFYVEAERFMRRNSKQGCTLLMFDIDQFKVVNDLFGSEGGDQILCEVAQRLRDWIGDGGVCGRLEGDHFAVCLPSRDYSDNQLESLISKPSEALGVRRSLIFHVGVYAVEDLQLPVDQMCDRAALALRTVKGNYMQRIAHYHTGMREAMLREQEIAVEMGGALASGQFFISLQPIFDAQTGIPVGAEALARWLHPDRGMIQPSRFVSVFEKNQFISRLDFFVVEEVCKLLRDCTARGEQVAPVSVNLSRVDLYDPDISHRLVAMVNKYDISRNLLKIEITESALSENPAQLIDAMQELRRNGFLVLMDDFGTGYSSLNMLKDAPVETLKIDMSITRDIARLPRAMRIVESIIWLAKSLEIQVVAEGVETERQYQLLRAAGCDFIQGFYFSKPLPGAEYRALLQEYARFLPGRADGLPQESDLSAGTPLPQESGALPADADKASETAEAPEL